MNIVALHGYILGITLIGSWFIVMVLALILRLAKPDGELVVFWRVVSIAQIILVVQLVLGLVLLLLGGRPADNTFDTVFHFLYGFVFPGIVLFVGHKYARDGRAHPLTVFATVGLVNFGLTARAFMVAVVS